MHSNNQSRWSEEYQVTVDELNAGEKRNGREKRQREKQRPLLSLFSATLLRFEKRYDSPRQARDRRKSKENSN